jgi:hypothetical protein
MDSSRKPDDEGPEGEPRPEPDRGEATEDRAAILSRRAFLIESALASAGITVGLAGCGPSKKETVPQVCLSIALPPPDAAAPASQPPRPSVCLQPTVCLSPARPGVCLRVAPQKCLKVAPPRERRDGGVPRPCLSRPRVCLQPPRPRACLSIAPPTKKPSGKICLSFNGRE